MAALFKRHDQAMNARFGLQAKISAHLVIAWRCAVVGNQVALDETQEFALLWCQANFSQCSICQIFACRNLLINDKSKRRVCIDHPLRAVLNGSSPHWAGSDWAECGAKNSGSKRLRGMLVTLSISIARLGVIDPRSQRSTVDLSTAGMKSFPNCSRLICPLLFRYSVIFDIFSIPSLVA